MTEWDNIMEYLQIRIISLAPGRKGRRRGYLTCADSQLWMEESTVDVIN